MTLSKSNFDTISTSSLSLHFGTHPLIDKLQTWRQFDFLTH